MTDLTTTYLGLHLKNPLVASASPLSKRLDRVHQLEDAGAAAVVMYSLFEEQITNESHELDHYLNRGKNSYAESLSYFPDLEQYNMGPEAYLEHLYKVKQAVDIPIIGSLNGISSGGWIQYAHKIEQAGADALELNIYYLPTDPELSSAELEDTYISLVRDVRATINIPIAVKLSPFFTALPAMTRRFVEAGANGLVLFNRFYQPDFDLEALEVVPHLVLSSSDDLHLPLRWIALLYGRINADFALSSGVHTVEDVLKAMMAGARVAMTTSELLKAGISRLTEIQKELKDWMEEHEYVSIAQMQKMQRTAQPSHEGKTGKFIKRLNRFLHFCGGERLT